MFTETPVGTDSSQPVQLTATKRDGGVVMIRIRLVEELQPSDFHFTQFFNILLRKVSLLKPSSALNEHFEPIKDEMM